MYNITYQIHLYNLFFITQLYHSKIISTPDIWFKIRISLQTCIIYVPIRLNFLLIFESLKCMLFLYIYFSLQGSHYVQLFNHYLVFIFLYLLLSWLDLGNFLRIRSQWPLYQPRLLEWTIHSHLRFWGLILPDNL